MAHVDFAADEGDGYVGDFTATLNFASGDLTGSATGFYYQNGEAPGITRAGTVILTSDDVGANFNVAEFNGLIGGNLDTRGGQRALTGEVIGGFGGVQADMRASLGEADVGGESQTPEIFIIAD